MDDLKEPEDHQHKKKMRWKDTIHATLNHEKTRTMIFFGGSIENRIQISRWRSAYKKY